MAKEIKEEKKMRRIFYAAVIGNLCMIVALFCPFMRIDTEEEQEYTTAVYGEQVTQTQEEPQASESSSTQTEEAKQEVVVLKGYSRSLAGYLAQKLPDEKKQNDIQVLKNAAAYRRAQELDKQDLSSEERVTSIKNCFADDNSKEVIDKYAKKNTAGVVVVVAAIACLTGAVVLSYFDSYRLSMLLTFASTLPLWIAIGRLNGVTKWKMLYGGILFMAGLFIAMASAITGDYTIHSTDTEKK